MLNNSLAASNPKDRNFNNSLAASNTKDCVFYCSLLREIQVPQKIPGPLLGTGEYYYHLINRKQRVIPNETLTAMALTRFSLMSGKCDLNVRKR